MGGIGALRSRGEHSRLAALSGVPVMWAGAPFWIALDTVVSDALGHDRASQLRLELARDLARTIVVRSAPTVGAGSGPPMLQLARGLSVALGEGRISIESDGRRRRGVAQAPTVGTVWRANSPVDAAAPADGYLAGWLAAGIELALRRDPNTIGAREVRCVATGAPRCEFDFVRTDPMPPRSIPLLPDVDLLCEDPHDESEFEIASLASRTINWLESQRADADGRIQPLGVPWIVRPAAWAALLARAAIQTVEDEAPDAVSALLALLRECAIRAVIGDVGRVIVSDWWEAIAGGLPVGARTATVHSLAVARAFGWGRWTLAELEPERRLVLRVPASPVAAVLRAGEGTTDVSRDWFASGVAEAIGRLVLGMAWSDDHDVPVERVLDRVHDRDELVTEVSTCITAGADATTIVVETATGG